jgi:hypothetical protein
MRSPIRGDGVVVAPGEGGLSGEAGVVPRAQQAGELRRGGRQRRERLRCAQREAAVAGQRALDLVGDLASVGPAGVGEHDDADARVRQHAQGRVITVDGAAVADDVHLIAALRRAPGDSAAQGLGVAEGRAGQWGGVVVAARRPGGELERDEAAEVLDGGEQPAGRVDVAVAGRWLGQGAAVLDDMADRQPVGGDLGPLPHGGVHAERLEQRAADRIVVGLGAGGRDDVTEQREAEVGILMGDARSADECHAVDRPHELLAGGGVVDVQRR